MRKLVHLLIITSLMAFTSCSKNKYDGTNPLLMEWDTPFGIPPFKDITPGDFIPAIKYAIEVHDKEIDAIVKNSAAPDFENTILAFDNSGQMLGRIDRILSLWSSADSDDDMRAVQKEASPLQTAHTDDVNLNEELFRKIETVYNSRSNLDPLQKRLTEKIYDRFVNSGVGLSAQGKEALRKLNEEISDLTLQFGDNLLKANNDFKMFLEKEDLTGIPSGIRDGAAAAAKREGEEGKYLFTVSRPSIFPFLTNSDRSDLREQIYNGYINKCNYGDDTDNRDIINKIVSLRTQKAKLLGYETHAHYMLRDRMAPSPEAVYSLLDQLWGPALESAKAELEEMKSIKSKETGSDSFMAWDWWYFAEKVRKDKYALDEEMLKPYFSLPNVQAGIFELSNRLYGVTFRPLSNVPVYHKDCVVYEVLDIDNNHLGILIMDFYLREGRKKQGAWCGSYRSRTYDNGEKTDPIVTIVCNFPDPVGNKPSLLNLDETETFFHEFGHALHSLFTDVPYRGLNRVERDFVELPSQIMENWAFEPQMLRSYATHYTTKAVIPETLIEKITNSRYFNQGFAFTEFLAASYSDMDIYTISDFTPLDLNAFEREVLNNRRGLIPEIAPRYRYPYFSHIFNGGYSAGYYSYVWAEVLDKDAYEAFIESGDLFDRRTAESFRKNILNKGGSEDGMTMYRNFRGHDPAMDPLLYGRGLKERPAKVNDDLLIYEPEEEGEAPDSITTTLTDPQDI